MADENRLNGAGSPETDVEKLIELRPVFNQLRRLTMDAMRRGDKKSNLAYIKVRDILIATPAVKAKPVTHAHWRLKDNKGNGICSNCNRQDKIDPLAGYCRYCGAQMDAKDDNLR